MNDIKRILIDLISTSNNKKRIELYKNFHNIVQNVTIETKTATLNRIYTNLSGLMAHSELGKNEYDRLKLLLQQLERYSALEDHFCPVKVDK